MSAEVLQYSNPELFMSWPKRLPEPARIIAMPSCAPDLDHGLVEAVMARIISKTARAQFWLDHVDILGTALLDRGIAEPVVQSIMRDHLERVREIHAERMAMPRSQRAIERSPINFTEPPPVGTEIYVGGKRAVLVRIEPYIRKTDGQDSLLLIWDVEGRKATSGMRTGRVHFVAEDSDADT